MGYIKLFKPSWIGGSGCTPKIITLNAYGSWRKRYCRERKANTAKTTQTTQPLDPEPIDDKPFHVFSVVCVREQCFFASIISFVRLPCRNLIFPIQTLGHQNQALKQKAARANTTACPLSFPTQTRRRQRCAPNRGPLTQLCLKGTQVGTETRTKTKGNKS